MHLLGSIKLSFLQLHGETGLGGGSNSFSELRRVVAANVEKLENLETRENNSCCARIDSVSRRMELAVDEVEAVCCWSICCCISVQLFVSCRGVVVRDKTLNLLVVTAGLILAVSSLGIPVA